MIAGIIMITKKLCNGIFIKIVLQNCKELETLKQKVYFS